MNSTVSIRCPECGTITYNSDHCSHCGALINVHLKRERAREEKAQERIEENKGQKPGWLESIATWGLNHPYGVVRFLARTVYAIWAFIGMVIGALIAIVISLVSG